MITSTCLSCGEPLADNPRGWKAYCSEECKEAAQVRGKLTGGMWSVMVGRAGGGINPKGVQVVVYEVHQDSAIAAALSAMAQHMKVDAADLWATTVSQVRR